jgi:hypothetical protein
MVGAKGVSGWIDAASRREKPRLHHALNYGPDEAEP